MCGKLVAINSTLHYHRPCTMAEPNEDTLTDLETVVHNSSPGNPETDGVATSLAADDDDVERTTLHPNLSYWNLVKLHTNYRWFLVSYIVTQLGE